MSVKTNLYLNNFQQDTSFGMSPAVWGFQGIPGAGIAEMNQNPGFGRFAYENFTGFPSIGAYPLAAAFQGGAKDWAVYAYAGTTLSDAIQEGGGLTVANSTTSQGAAFQSNSSSFQFMKSDGTYREYMVFEWGGSVSTITASQGDMFVGLTDCQPQTGKPITTTAGTLAAGINFFGFQRISTAPTDWAVVWQKSGQSAVYPTGLQTLLTTALGAAMTANQYVKLGFIFNPTPANNQVYVYNPTTGQTQGTFRRPLVQFFVNNLVLPLFLTSDNLVTANFPVVPMGRCFAFMSNSGGTVTMTNNFLGAAQISNI